MALFTFGEGYHNYHHEFQHDYRNGVKWWQWDPTKWTIWILKTLRLVRGLRRVPDYRILLAQLAEMRRQLGARLACQQRPLPDRLRELLQASDAKLDELTARWATFKIEYAAKADQKIRDARAALAELRQELRQAIELLEMAGVPA
jgi:stearoyl-CoA desaturase (delta-9 desaturase)